MKTLVILNPKNCYERIQKSNGYFDATHFLKFYNEAKVDAENKLMANYLKLSTTKEFVDYLEKIELINLPIKKSTKGTWMHPKVFIDFSMWLSVEFKSMAIQWVLDGLVKERNIAGDNYNELVSTIMTAHIEFYNCKPTPMTYINEARKLKKLVGILERNEATEKELTVLNALQKIDIGLIKAKIGKESRYKQLELIAKSLLV